MEQENRAICRRGCRLRRAGADQQSSAHSLSYNKLRQLRRLRNATEQRPKTSAGSYQVHSRKSAKEELASDIAPLDPLRQQQPHHVDATSATNQRTNQRGPASKLAAPANRLPSGQNKSSEFIYQSDEQMGRQRPSATRNSSDHRRPANSGQPARRPPASGSNPLAKCTQQQNVIRNSMSSCRQQQATLKAATSSSGQRRMSRLVASLRLPVLLLLLLLLLLGCILNVGLAYQLTNNLIANNLPPRFVQTSGGAGGSGGASSEIVVRVKEGPQSIGKLIYTLKAEDPDEDPLTFGVLSSMASELVRIENTGGNQANVYLRKELDRETSESHQVVITLTDGKLGKGNWVEDVNDNYPVFGAHRTAISIREDTKFPLVIETLEASDADEGRFGQVVYKLDELTSGESSNSQDARSAGQPISSMFSIETIDGKGVISLIGQLDYEQRPLYQLRVLAIDRAIEHERLSTSTSILISVEDCEDQPPMFTFAPSITRIPEDLPVGSPILRLSAIDGDRGVNNPIKYSIVSVNNQESGFERNLFSIGSDSGQISVAQELDRELTLAFGDSPASSKLAREARQSAASSGQPGAYLLQVRASEVSSLQEGAGSEANSVTTELTLILTDVNDETPQFNREHFFGELLENSPAESLVNFVLGSSQPNAPGQQAAVQTSGTEAGAKVFDRDQGTNGTFTLHLEGEHGHLFDVWPSEATNEASIMLKVSTFALQEPSNGKFFDYEKTTELRLTLVAREKFPAPGSSRRRSSSADMRIQLRDANDNYPQFGTELYRVEIPENAQRGMHICVVKALDADSGPFGTAGVRYTEIRGERANKFKLDPATGVITLKTNEHGFDRETIPQHHLIVEARDNNGQGNRNTTQLLIVLTDVNDQRPKFLLDQYEAFIYENELDFQSPLQVQALDGDAPNSANSRLTYSIVGGDPQSNFTIEPQTGRIRVRTSHVMPPPPPPPPPPTNSRGSQQQSGSRATPSDGESDIVIASESASQATVAIQATGLDFERIAQKRDDTRQFNLTVKATDSGQPEPLSGTTQVIVLVYDKNDHAPVFTRPVYSKSIREDAPAGSAVIQAQALDGDHSPTNSKITYRISSGASDKFLIDSDSGLISVANGANLDIDRAAGGGQKRTNYLLNILALDGSFGASQKSASALVNITIVDVNNKAPEFVSLGASLHQPPSQTTTKRNSAPNPLQPATVFVNEDAPYGLIVTRVFATDLDSSAELRYAINYSRSEARNEEMELVEPSLYRDVFAIDPQDGTIKVAKPLDRELFDQIKLRLQVEDLGAQTADQVSHSYLTIKISDVNDNRPTFKRPLYKAVVNENSISGTSVITLTADDRDLNKSVKYSLEASSPEVARLIRINPRSGEVTVNDKIDRELFPLINVTVKAEDFGQPHPLTGSCQLIVAVRDENDNNPIFLNVTHMRASSSSTLSSAHSRQAPTVAPQQELAGEQFRNHNMQTAGSAASSYRHRSLGPLGEQPAPELEEASATLKQDPRSQWQPLDEQGRELELLAPGSTARVREDAPVGHQVAYVRAEDADVGNNGRVTYLLDANSSGGGRFRIDRDSGILSVAQTLDRETQRQFALIIEACDNYDLGYSTGESRRAFTQVNIQVTDVNDNPPIVRTNLHQAHHSQSGAPQARGYPTFDEAMQAPGPHDMPLAECLIINEFQAPNEPILTITASDLDDPETPNGQIDLAIINNLPQNEMFSLLPIKPTAGGFATHANALADAVANEEPVSVGTSTQAPAASTATDLSGFGDLLVGSESSARPAKVRVKAKRSIEEVETVPFLEPGNFYPAPNGPVRSSGGGAGSSSARNLATTTTIAPQQATASRVSGESRVSAGEQQMHIVVSQSLREKVGNYSILVRATDRGTPALSSLKLINVCVEDVNNHAPVFTRPPLNHTIRIMENATIGSFVTQVEASDSDHGLNGELQYLLKPTNIQNSNNDWQAFKIDRLSGIISTTKLFNRQLKKHYTLRVQAQDFGRPTSLSSDIDINIMIVNSGAYQPEFEHQQQAFEFTENSPPGQVWFTLLQTTNLDDDPALIHVNSLLTAAAAAAAAASANSQEVPTQKANGSNWLSSPCYHIVDGDDRNQVFHLDRYTHRLTNQRELDRERKANYTLIVQASNNCNKQDALPMSSRPNRLVNSESSPTTTTASATSSPASDNLELASSAAALRRFVRGALGDRLREAPRSGKRIQSDEDETVDLTSAAKVASPERLQSVQATAVEVAAAAQLISPPVSWDTLVTSDKSLLKLTIKIRDVNDNAPRFTQKIYTGGITTEADFGTIFMIVQAIDLDADANGQVAYSIVRPIKRNLSMSSSASSSLLAASSPPSRNSNTQSPASTRQKRATSQQAGRTTTTSTTGKPTHLQFPFNSNIVNEVYANDPVAASSGGGAANELANSLLLPDGEDLFLINAQTGEISLNFDPQKHMKGYFEFEILAKDPDGLSDSARVFIYLLRQDQRVKFVLRLTPQELRQRLNKFRSVMGNITGAIVNIDSYKYYENHDGTVDKKKTSLYLHFVKHDDNTIIDVDKVLTLIDNNIEYLDELYKEFHVLSSEAAHLPLSSGALVDPIDQVRTGLLGISSFLALILVLVIALCLNQRTRYERQLKAATVTAFGSAPLHLDPDFHSQTNLPNTNLHSQDPNPIWINGHYGNARDDSQIDWLSGSPPGSAHDHPTSTIKRTGGKRTSAQDKQTGKGQQPQQQQQQQQLYRSASSGVGMALDELDCLSSSEGDHSSDLNSLSGGANSVGQLHYNVATATATPRDSLNSSHGQASSSSGSNSASTTNERQLLCTGASQKLKTSSPQQLRQVANVAGKNQTKVKLNNSANVADQPGSNSTFGAFKEVAIYTERQQQEPAQQRSFNYLVASQQQQQQHSQGPSKAGGKQARQVAATGNNQQQQSSHVNKLASQFNAAKLQKQSIYVVGGQRTSGVQESHQTQNQQKSRILVHQNGSDVSEGIIRTARMQQQQQNGAATKQMQNHLDAKFVPANLNELSQQQRLQHQQQQQDQTVANFETSLSKLSILNLETTEL